jgi:hypothetical protein
MQHVMLGKCVAGSISRGTYALCLLNHSVIGGVGLLEASSGTTAAPGKLV